MQHLSGPCEDGIKAAVARFGMRKTPVEMVEVKGEYCKQNNRSSALKKTPKHFGFGEKTSGP